MQSNLFQESDHQFLKHEDTFPLSPTACSVKTLMKNSVLIQKPELYSFKLLQKDIMTIHWLLSMNMKLHWMHTEHLPETEDMPLLTDYYIPDEPRQQLEK